jgi:hypothetical protein
MSAAKQMTYHLGQGFSVIDEAGLQRPSAGSGTKRRVGSCCGLGARFTEGRE